ncbi:hypothetical protein H5410_020681 [Solanum commersonii]|uniref:Uncharacterized protein n=1 Tax=Solanum commersonii TaxID=4109 RepID=A0A9J5ZC02_SOLCO|nr:hypothetical protein H5410_020681 [Solanum commersonii]
MSRPPAFEDRLIIKQLLMLLKCLFKLSLLASQLCTLNKNMIQNSLLQKHRASKLENHTMRITREKTFINEHPDDAKNNPT